MKAAVMYKSLTGNTKLVAEAVRDSLSDQEIVWFGGPDASVEADLYFIGSWTDKGMCDGEITKLLKRMEHKRIAIFGTAGFGGSREYYDQLLARIEGAVPASNEVIGGFYCQGKMPLGVRDRYVAMLREHPDDRKLAASVQNFDEALTHPDEKDLLDVGEWVRSIVRQQ